MEQEVKNIFNIRISSPFWETLARVYLQKYSQNRLDLAGVLFLLPNRRACQALTAAFIRLQGMQPTILPQMTPIAELDDDEIFFNGFNLSEAFREERPTIGKEERLFIFSRLIMSKPNDFGLKQISLAQALSLAIDLAKLIDTACSQGLSFDKLQDLVPEKYATHWQETLKLLKIITEYWPQILAERKAVDCCDLKTDYFFTKLHSGRKKKHSKTLLQQELPPVSPLLSHFLKASGNFLTVKFILQESTALPIILIGMPLMKLIPFMKIRYCWNCWALTENRLLTFPRHYVRNGKNLFQKSCGLRRFPINGAIFHRILI